MNNLIIAGLTRFSVDPRSIINRQKRTLNKRYIKEAIYNFLYRPKSETRSLEMLADILYSKKRLLSRLKLFKQYPLASMAHLACRNSNLRYKVFYSSLLPQDIVRDLHYITSPYSSWCQCIAVNPSRSFFSTCQQSIHQYSDSYVYSFRLDDDDALGSDYIERVLQAVSLDSDKYIYSMPFGYTLARVANDHYVLNPKEQFKIALGLGRLSPPKNNLTIFDEEYLHGLIPDSKVNKLETPPIWIRTVHDSNDSIPELPCTVFLTADEVINSLGTPFTSFINKNSLQNLPIVDMTPDQSTRKLIFYYQ